MHEIKTYFQEYLNHLLHYLYKIYSITNNQVIKRIVMIHREVIEKADFIDSQKLLSSLRVIIIINRANTIGIIMKVVVIMVIINN